MNVIPPPAGTSEYTVVLHFDTIDNIRGWLDSAERRQLIGKALPFLQPLAPTQSEPPLVVAQAVVLLAFVALGALAVIRFHPEIKTVV